MNNLVSVIIPYRNAEKYIFQTLEAVLAQTYSNFELLCVDNGSSDDSTSVVRDFANNDDRICELEFPHAGKSLALNYGLSRATGAWIAICDADDTWDSEKLEKQALFMDRFPEYDVIGTQMRYVNDAGAQFKEAPFLPLHHDGICESIFKRKENPVCNSSVMYKKSLHDVHVGFYDPLCAVEDYDLWSRCAFAGLKFANLEDVLVSHRLHDNSNFNSSRKQSYHKQLVDAKIDAYNSIEEALAEKE